MAVDRSQPGYFRIGLVELQIPPTDISTNRVVNDDQLATLRSSSSMFIKSGQARWDVTIRWKALKVQLQDGTFDYSQWQDLRQIVAMFKASPFVECENDFLRQHFTNIQIAYQSARMAFAMKQLRIDTNPDSSNIVDVTLTMSLFNYTPYSPTFGYVGSTQDALPVDAIDSPAYNQFIGQWIASNMDSVPHAKGEPSLLPWDQQEEGDVSFIWRKYVYSPFDTPPPQTISKATTSQSGQASSNYTPINPTPRKGKNSLPPEIQSIVNTAANLYKLDPAIVTAQCLVESGGNPNAKSTTSTAAGLFQIVAGTAKQLGITNVLDPTQNAQGACKYLAQQFSKFGNYPQALAAYNTGQATVVAYSQGKVSAINPRGLKTANGLPPAGVPVPSANANVYVSKILTLAGKPNLLTPVIQKGQNNTPPPQPTDSSILDTPNQGIIDKVNAAIQSLPPADPDQFWQLDHYSEQGAYFYQEETITLAGVDSSNEGDFSLYPNQLSIVFVNNLPMIPLAGMQYPTYQHVGPTDTMISISMNSVGSDNTELNEPEHDGIIALSVMSNTLENQFHDLRTHFRAVSSIHRMQAVFIQNQILNMLGIRGTMLRGLNTETIQEASNLVQVSIAASQYENIFEETTPFRINGASGAYKGNLQTFLKSGSLQKASKEEQNAYQSAQQFSTAWQKHDPSFLLNEILNISKQKIDVLSTINVPSAQLRPDQQAFVLEILNVPELGNGLSTIQVIQQTVATLAVPHFVQPTQSDTYPGLAIRRKALSGSATAPMTYADYFVFTQLPSLGDTDERTLATIKAQTDNKFSAQKDQFLETMYQKLFDYELLTNPLFSRQIQAIANSPAFRNQYAGEITVDGPAMQNPGHYCYKDLGLTGDYREQPGGYFINYNSKLNNTTNGNLQTILATATSGANAVNNQLTAEAQHAAAAGNTSEAAKLTAFGTQGFVFSGGNEGLDSTTQTLTGGADSLSRIMNIPAFSMNSAFPTFKLMLLEEDNSGPFFAFDNFYSYATVIDIEVIKYPDKPDTAIIQISNLAHILEHRMYDDTAAGKLEKSADKFNIDPNGGIITGGSAAGEVGTGGGIVGSSITAGKTAAGAPYQLRKNYTEGRGETYSRIPLKFYALQTGSKIQVRMGYDNNPDNLFPVFTGQITEIEGNEVLTITAQSFQLELLNSPGTSVIANTRWGLSFLNSGGAAMGGWSLSNAGDTFSVIEKMITAETARHFGHWQIGGQVDPLLKGFQWSALLGTTLSATSNGTLQSVGSLLQTGYDRSGENILVNSTISYDATKSHLNPANQGRRTFDEETSWLQSYFSIGTASYSIPKQSELSVWEIIKDVSRRYPHFNLLVKDYGFPYGADATLVYAHPLDWYYSRPPLFGEDEKETANNATQGSQFRQWWSSVGAAKWNDIWANAYIDPSNPDTTVLQAVAGSGLNIALQQLQAPLSQVASSGPQGFVTAIEQLHQLFSGTLTAIQGVPNVVAQFANTFLALVTSGNITRGFYQNLDNNFQALLRSWEAYLVQASPAANSDRIKPVRKYHLIDHNHIVHNGIVVNDKIYNAVKIMDEAPYQFNQNIPGQHLRVLNVTEMINDPEHNCATQQMKRVYAQSFLREEVGKMYRGELILRGVPEIEPSDIVLMNDPSTGIVGPVEVDTVIHSFNMDNGFITIIKPRCWVIANESVSMNLTRALGFAWANAFSEINSLGAVFSPTGPFATTSGTILAGGALAGATAAAIAVGVFAPPLGIMLAGLALLAGYGIITYVEAQSLLNFFKLQPLSRFGRPWIGGLQGFKISDFAYSILQGLQYFDAEEIAPTIESWDELINYRADYIQGI